MTICRRQIRLALLGCAAAAAPWAAVLAEPPASGATPPSAADYYRNPAAHERREASEATEAAYFAGRYREAWDGLVRDIAACQAAPDQPADCLALLNMAAANAADWTGQSRLGEGYARQALALAEASLPPGHTDTATAAENLAYTLNAEARYAEAEPLFRKALAIWEAAFPAKHPVIAMGYNNLAMNLDAQGRYAEAAVLFRQALAMREAALPAGHPDIAQSYHNLAATFDNLGDYPAAERLYRKALAMRTAVLPAGHPDIAQSYNDLAHNLDHQGLYAEAGQLYLAAIATVDVRPERSDPAVLLFRGNFAELALHRLGQPGEALVQYRRLAEARDRDRTTWRRYLEAGWRTAFPGTPITSVTALVPATGGAAS